jgi:hypothetical protein
VKLYDIFFFVQGIDTASDVANLVAKAFSTNTNNIPTNRRRNSDPTKPLDATGSAQSQTPGENHLINSMLRLMGLEPGKMGALALNGVIFLAQMVRHGLENFMSFSMTSIWDWYMIWNNLRDRLQIEQQQYEHEISDTNNVNSFNDTVNNVTTTMMTIDL